MIGSKLACEAPFLPNEGDVQRFALEKNAESVANLNTCEV